MGQRAQAEHGGDLVRAAWRPDAQGPGQVGVDGVGEMRLVAGTENPVPDLHRDLPGQLGQLLRNGLKHVPSRPDDRGFVVSGPGGEPVRRERRINVVLAATRGLLAHSVSLRSRRSRSAKGTADKPGRNVRQEAGLNKAVLDVGFGEINRQIEYKARWHAVTIARVPAFFPSSKTCHRCDWIDTGQTLGDREPGVVLDDLRLVGRVPHQQTADLLLVSLQDGRHCSPGGVVVRPLLHGGPARHQAAPQAASGRLCQPLGGWRPWCRRPAPGGCPAWAPVVEQPSVNALKVRPCALLCTPVSASGNGLCWCVSRPRCAATGPQLRRRDF
ncbi:zinc ribbon domain-containing protein [Streptomyces sp. NBC_01431]|uniref:zinc ribbon domain-containing protein n=1 Tax=Streptomyces sp. NBC_01431 TaxID=2903863 RepID=UPI003FCC4125